MIVYGTRTPHVATERVNNLVCENCENQNTLRVSVFRTHAHVFWIPLFPIYKKVFSECDHCKQVLKEKEMPERLKRKAVAFKKDAKGPIWQFAGLLLIAVLVIAVSVSK